jgi:N-acyl-D-aspartate/D-glutamate deacylase
MFQRRRTYLELSHLPIDQLLEQLRRPEIKARILADEDVKPDLPGSMENIYGLLGMAAASMFPLSVPMNYEPEASTNLGALAAQAGQEIDSFVYDFLIAEEGRNFAISLGANFVEGNFDVIRKMIEHPNTTIGLSDAGAHVNLIFDAVGPTYQLMHWVRDRTRGPKLPIEMIVNKQTARNADLFGLQDRGRLLPGQRADLNIIDLSRLSLGELKVAHDLPAGGGRILQSASGYLNTFVSGVKTRALDEDTGARPGRLIRG